MATITTQDSSLSFLTNTLGGFSSTAAAKMPVLGDRLAGFVENLYAAVEYGYPDYVSNSRIVLETFYPTYGYVTINGSGLTGNSPTITRMAFDGGGFSMVLSGNIRATSSGAISGSLSRISVGDGEQTLLYTGSMSLTTGAARYTSLTYTVQAVRYAP